jgi:MinD superfamily P-loop ATPase
MRLLKRFVMHEILVISGKGGTGKTSLTSAFAHLAGGKIICDLDVDAPDLHLLLHPEHRECNDFYSGYEARIVADRCQTCGICQEMCRYDAIDPGESHPVINQLKCEGCKVCVEFCPHDAIDFTAKHCGTWFRSDTRFGPMMHAQLFPAEENSGRLVALLRQKAKEIATEMDLPLILSDGPPGIGCPVISAISGVYLSVIVTEPTPSGLHDLERIASLCDHFSIPVAVIINKSDLNAQIARQIKTVCRRRGYTLAAELPHDPVFVQAMVAGKAVTEFSDGAATRAVVQAWERISALARLGDAEKAGSNAA